MATTKRVLGINYVTGTGILLIALFIPTLVQSQRSPSSIILGGMGLFAAVGLAGSGYWLERSSMRAEQVWRVATHAGVGIGVVTLANLIVVADGSVVSESAEATVLASTIVIGGASGSVVGIVREYDRSTTTLTQSTEVLSRALRHNLRNDMTVILGQLDKLDAEISGQVAERTTRIRKTIDDVVTLSEKAQQIEIAVTDKGRHRHPIDAITCLTNRVENISEREDNVTIETDLPTEAWVDADWMLGIAIDNVIETAIDNGQQGARLKIDVKRVDRGRTAISIVDCNHDLPASEIETIRSGTETPLQHSQGLGLWLVSWVIDSYGGRLTIETTDEGTVVSMILMRAVPDR